LRDSKHGGKYCTEKQTDFFIESKAEISRKPFYKIVKYKSSWKSNLLLFMNFATLLAEPLLYPGKIEAALLEG